MRVKLQNVVPFQSGTLEDQKRKLDRFLNSHRRKENDHCDVPLILTADGRSRRITYRGISIREWYNEGRVRYDSAVELR